MAKTELEILEEISGKQDLTANEVKEVKAAAEAVKTESAELKTKVAELNTALATSGALVVDIQGEIKELKAKSGRMKGETQKGTDIRQLISDTILENKEAIIKSEKGPLVTNMELKTVGPILSANLTGTGNNYISYLDWRPGMEPIGQFRFRSLVRTIQSETDFVRLASNPSVHLQLQTLPALAWGSPGPSIKSTPCCISILPSFRYIGTRNRSPKSSV